MSEQTKKWFIPIATTVLGIVLTTLIAWGVNANDRITQNEKDILTIKEGMKFIISGMQEVKETTKETQKDLKCNAKTVHIMFKMSVHEVWGKHIVSGRNRRMGGKGIRSDHKLSCGIKREAVFIL